MKRDEVLLKIEEIARSVALAAGVELVDVELKGAGKYQTLLIVIDKPGGVTHSDCEQVSRAASEQIDLIDPISSAYELEVSSPGVERALKKWQDWERFVGHKVKVVLKQAPGGSAAVMPEPAPPLASKGQGPKKAGGKATAKAVDSKHFDGLLARAEGGVITLELPTGDPLTFPFEQVSRANLKFEW